MILNVFFIFLICTILIIKYSDELDNNSTTKINNNPAVIIFLQKLFFNKGNNYSYLVVILGKIQN